MSTHVIFRDILDKLKVTEEYLRFLYKGIIINHNKKPSQPKEAKRQPPIAEQLKAAQREAQEHRAPDGPKKKAPDRGDR